MWKPSLRGSSPAVLPLSAKVRPPPKAVRVPKQPLQPPPQHRAPAPVTQPEQYSFSIRSLKPRQITESQPLVTPGVSLSPDPSASASTTIRAAPPKGAASGAPADPDPNPEPEPESDQGPEEGEEGQEPGAGEEEGEFEEDQPIEIEEVAASAQRSRVRSRERPPAVVLRGRAVRSRSPPPRHTRHHRATPPQPVEQQQRPQRISLLDMQSLHIQRSVLTDRVLGLRPHQHVGLLEQIPHSQLFPYHQISLITRGTRTNGRRLFGGILLRDIRSL